MDYTISKEEIDDYITTNYSQPILDLYIKIKDECESNGVPILNNKTNSCSSDFLKLIFDCLDKNKIYESNIKFENNVKISYK